MATTAALLRTGMDLDAAQMTGATSGKPALSCADAFDTSHSAPTAGRTDGAGASVTRLPTAAGGQSRYSSSDERFDHFIQREGKTFAGTHLIIDLWDAERLDDLQHVEQALLDCVTEAGATLLHIHLHHFTPNGGVSGVAVLAESHISIHSWPECGYAALDVFMCGEARPHAAIEVLRRAFRPGRVGVKDLLRGEVTEFPAVEAAE